MFLRKSIVALAAAATCFSIAASVPAKADEVAPTTTVNQQSQKANGTAVQAAGNTKAVNNSASTTSSKDDEKVVTVLHLNQAAKPSESGVQTPQTINLPLQTSGPGSDASVMMASANMSRSDRIAAALAARRERLANHALSYRGTPYVWGGTSSITGFDCSGFTQYLYKLQGISLPHKAALQFKMGRAISRDDIQAGDLVFFNTSGPISHVGMALGDGKFIHAANPRKGVRIDSLANSYYVKTYAGARRYK